MHGCRTPAVVSCVLNVGSARGDLRCGRPSVPVGARSLSSPAATAPVGRRTSHVRHDTDETARGRHFRLRCRGFIRTISADDLAKLVERIEGTFLDCAIALCRHTVNSSGRHLQGLYKCIIGDLEARVCARDISVYGGRGAARRRGSDPALHRAAAERGRWECVHELAQRARRDQSRGAALPPPSSRNARRRSGTDADGMGVRSPADRRKRSNERFRHS